MAAVKSVVWHVLLKSVVWHVLVKRGISRKPFVQNDPWRGFLECEELVTVSRKVSNNLTRCKMNNWTRAVTELDWMIN